MINFHESLEGILSLLAMVVGLAALAVIVSQKANTASVIQASSSGFASIIGAAVAPITGATSSSSSFSTGF